MEKLAVIALAPVPTDDESGGEEIRFELAILAGFPILFSFETVITPMSIAA